jgi:hypothetical protein
MPSEELSKAKNDLALSVWILPASDERSYGNISATASHPSGVDTRQMSSYTMGSLGYNVPKKTNAIKGCSFREVICKAIL